MLDPLPHRFPRMQDYLIANANHAEDTRTSRSDQEGAAGNRVRWREVGLWYDRGTNRCTDRGGARLPGGVASCRRGQARDLTRRVEEARAMKPRLTALAALAAVPLVLSGCLQGRGPAGDAGNRAQRMRAFAPVQIEAGKAYLAADQPNDAFVCFRRAIRIDPQNYEAQLGLAQASTKIGATRAGLNAAEAAAKLKPGQPEALLAAGQLSLASQRPAEAEKYLREALRLNPKFAAAWRDLGETKLIQKAVGESVSALERARQLSPNDAEIRGKLGAVYVAAGRYREAIAEYQAAVKLDTKTAVYPRSLAWLLIQQGQRLDEARALAKKADDLERGDGDALVAAAVALLRQGNVEDALNELRDDLGKVDNNGDLYIYFAEAAATRGKQGDYENAVRALETVRGMGLPHRRVTQEQVRKLVERIKTGLEQERARVQGSS